VERDDRAPDREAEIEGLRILREYRRLVLMGRARIPLAEARRLVGPDCAFHLYFRDVPAGRASVKRQRSRKRRLLAMRRRG